MFVICDLLPLLYQGEQVLNAITGGNATLATKELGLQIRRLCPLQSVKLWKKIDQSTKDVVQAVLIIDRKAYLLYKDWRYNLKQEFLKLEEQGVDDPYSHPPTGVRAWRTGKDESHLKRSKVGKANRHMLPYNHTSGSRSFPIAMSLMVDEDGDLDFPEFYKKSHNTRRREIGLTPNVVSYM
ncbi:hypothetical protein ACSBR2_015077 [Camellia fascicularis]